MAMEYLTHVSFSVVESQTLSVKTGGTWPLETFLAFAKIYIFSPEALFTSDVLFLFWRRTRTQPAQFYVEIIAH